MKQFLLTLILTGLILTAFPQDIYSPSDSLLAKHNTGESITPVSHPQNNYSVGVFGSSKLPIGYQLFFNLENIGKRRSNMGILINNQFSTHSNYDLSATIIKRSLIIHNSRLTDVTSINLRTRKLHFFDKERVSENYSIGYSLVYNGKLNFGAGIDCDRGIEEYNGILLTAGRFFPALKINVSGQMSFFEDITNWRGGISKTFTLNPNSTAIYGVEFFYEEYRSYNDISVGMVFYL